MSTVADIGVNVWAKGDQAVNEFQRVRNAGKETFTGMIGEVEGFAHKLHEGLGVLRGFRSITELGFGVGIGRQLFEQVHEGVTHLVEGFAEGLQHGETFFESLGDGGAKLLGMKTHFEEAAEAAEKYNKQVEALAHAREVLDKLTGRKEDLPYQNMTGAENADSQKQLAELRQKRDEAAAELKRISDEREHPGVMNKITGFIGDTFAGAEKHREAQSKEDAAAALVRRFDDAIGNFQKELAEANKNRPVEKDIGDLEDKMGAQQHAAALKAKEKAGHEMESVYHHMAEAAKRGAEKAKQEAQRIETLLREASPLHAAQERLKDLNKIRNQLTPDEYLRNREKIAEEYAKKNGGDGAMSRGDTGKAEQYGTVEAFKAVEDSRQAMAGAQDKNLDLLEAQKDLQSDMAASLKTLAAKPGTNFTVVDFG